MNLQVRMLLITEPIFESVMTLITFFSKKKKKKKYTERP